MDSHTQKKILLDNEYKIAEGDWVVIVNPLGSSGITFPIIQQATAIKPLSVAGYGISGKSTKITLNERQPWITLSEPFSTIRNTRIYAQSSELELAEQPIEDDVCGGEASPVELEGYYDGLNSGDWVIITGERTDIPDTITQASERVMVETVRQGISTHQDKLHTFLTFANDLAYCYKRDTVHIYGNVVEATHGETRHEVLGSGNGAKALQSFTLRQPPLTHMAASTPAGTESTLKLYVNDIRWQETDALAGLAPTARHFVTKTDDEDKTTLTFGNGQQGSRLPTGIENIKAEYRSGIGKPGNVKAGKIAQLMTRPLGVKEVVNPLPASGGADRETLDQIRKNAALAVKALDRLVSVQDYEDFTRIFAGIGKAKAVEIADDRRPLVHVTIAGADDIPIDENSKLYRNLLAALRKFGDPYRMVRVTVRELMLIALEARIRILPDYLWEPVVTQVRAVLLDAFSFERRELGQDVLLGEIIKTIQSVRGVAYVDVDRLRGIPETDDGKRLLTPAEIAQKIVDPLVDPQGKVIKEPQTRLRVNLTMQGPDGIRPAQLAFLSPQVPETLILNQIT